MYTSERGADVLDILSLWNHYFQVNTSGNTTAVCCVLYVGGAAVTVWTV